MTPSSFPNPELTLGMIVAASDGAESFSTAFSSGGMSGAVAQSIECHEKARGSASIYDLDECAAFDYAAQATDYDGYVAYNYPMTEYFEQTNDRLTVEYGRYSEHKPERLSALRDQTAKILAE